MVTTLPTDHTTEYIAEHSIEAPRADALLWAIGQYITVTPPHRVYGDLADAAELGNPNPLLEVARALAAAHVLEEADGLLAVRVGNIAESLAYAGKLQAMTAVQFAADYPRAVRGRAPGGVRLLQRRRADAQTVTAREAARVITDEGWDN